MQVNNTFSAGRFGAYFKKHLVDNYRFYLMSIIVLAGLALLALFIVTITNSYYHKLSDLLPIYLLGLFSTNVLFTSMSFSELGNKPHGIDYLLLPASNLEKFLTTLLVTTIGFLIVYHLAFFAAVKIFDNIMTVRDGHHLENDMVEYTKQDPWYYYYYGVFVAQAIFLLGAVYFHKFSLIKTTFSFIVLGIFLYLMNGLFVQLFFHGFMNDWKQQFPFVAINVDMGPKDEILRHYQQLTLTSNVSNIFLFMLKFLLAPVLWTIAYFRLREKEI